MRLTSAIAIAASLLVASCTTIVVVPMPPQQNQQMAQGGAAPAARPAKPSRLESAPFTVNIPNAAGQPVTFALEGRGFVPGSDYIRAIEAVAATELQTVVAQPTKIGGSLRIVGPAPESLAFTQTMGNRNAEAGRYTAQYFKVVNQLAIDAVKRANLFDSVSVATSAILPPSADGADYVMWKDGDIWVAREGTGPRVMVYNSNIGLADWAARLPDAFRRAKAARTDRSWTLNTVYLAGSPLYQFQGKEYLGLTELEEAMNSAMENEARAAKPAAQRPGGRAKVVLATHAAAQRAKITTSTSQADMSAKASIAYGAAIGRARAESMRAAKVFDSMVVEVADVAEMGDGDYDIVLWQPMSQPFNWMFRVKGGQPQRLPVGGGGVNEWVNSVSAALTKVMRPKAQTL